MRVRKSRANNLKFKPKTQQGILCFKKLLGPVCFLRESFWKQIGKPWRQRGITFSAVLGVLRHPEMTNKRGYRDHHLWLATRLLVPRLKVNTFILRGRSSNDLYRDQQPWYFCSFASAGNQNGNLNLTTLWCMATRKSMVDPHAKF